MTKKTISILTALILILVSLPAGAAGVNAASMRFLTIMRSMSKASEAISKFFRD